MKVLVGTFNQEEGEPSFNHHFKLWPQDYSYQGQGYGGGGGGYQRRDWSTGLQGVILLEMIS